MHISESSSACIFTDAESCFRPRTCNCKKALIGSNVGGHSALYLSCKVIRDWSIINMRQKSYLLDGHIFAALFEITSHCFC